MEIFLLGGTGMLGSEFRGVLSQSHELVAPDKKEVDIISWDVVIENLQKSTPDVVLNCVGFTDVDACESEAFAVRKINVEGPRNLAQGAARFQCKLIHFSSDYIFNGQKMIPQPYFEDDAPNPLSAYGKSKVESEVAVRENSPNYIIVRSGWLYSVHGKNFVKSIVRQAVKGRGKTIKVVDDQFGSPTWAHRLALQVKELIEKQGKGTYHATSEGYCSRFECAQYVMKKLRLKASVKPCRLRDIVRPAARPANCVLENRRLKKDGINIMTDWKQDLGNFLEEHGDTLIREARSSGGPKKA
jgi:dTDP-4-dehydrorhamnose reductase